MSAAGFPDHSVSVPGRLSLAGGPETPCRARAAPDDTFLIAVQGAARRGEAALCQLDRIGLIPGRVGPPHEEGFVLIPDLCEARRARVRARLARLVGHGREGIEQRDSPRFVPLHRTVAVRFADGLFAEGVIEDLSKSGARIRFSPAVEAHRVWLPGMQVTVGKRYALVVRTELETIAVRFRLPFTDDTFNPSVVL
jgi:hypothetical protein